MSSSPALGPTGISVPAAHDGSVACPLTTPPDPPPPPPDGVVVVVAVVVAEPPDCPDPDDELESALRATVTSP